MMLPLASAGRNNSVNVLRIRQPSLRMMDRPLVVCTSPLPVQLRSTTTSKQLSGGGGFRPRAGTSNVNSQTLATALRVADSKLPFTWNCSGAGEAKPENWRNLSSFGLGPPGSNWKMSRNRSVFSKVPLGSVKLLSLAETKVDVSTPLPSMLKKLASAALWLPETAIGLLGNALPLSTLNTKSPCSPKKPPTWKKIVCPLSAVKTTRDWRPAVSSLQVSWIRSGSEVPVNAARTVSYELPKVFASRTIFLLAVKAYQTVAPVSSKGSHCVGSSASVVASTVLRESVNDSPPITTASAKLSLPGWASAGWATGAPPHSARRAAASRALTTRELVRILVPPSACPQTRRLGRLLPCLLFGGTLTSGVKRG